MFKKKFDTINATIFILFLTVFGLSFITLYKDYQKRNLEVRLELTKQELQDTQGDRDYYQGQYKKYFELSEELQNQMGVFYE
ncbi:MAG: hypothetical protein UCK65_12045 [Thomasclavelia ramosa]|nr:hypothetical protein [Thomasclavelia ramosa]DAM67120.1 MAG TPA: cell division protein [Caudoviricetes sp.]